MYFSYNKAMLLRPKKERALSTFFFALIVSAAMILPYILTRAAFFTELFKSAVNSLPLTLFYKNGAVGTLMNVEANAGYLFAFPAAYATYIPENYLPYVMGAVVVLRISLAALMAYFFIRRFVRMPETARFGGLIYAFSSAVIGITLSGGMQNAVVLFPLVLLSLEKLLTENRKLIFLGTILLTAIFSGYALWSLIVFVIIYFIFRVTSKDVYVSLSVVFRVVFELVLGVLCAAVSLVPLIYITFVNWASLGDFIGIDVLFSGEEFLSVLRSLFFNPESVSSSVVIGESSAINGYFGMYIPVISFSGVIAFCGAKKYSSFKRIAIFSLISAFIPLISKAFSLLNPASLHTWTFMPTLILVLVSVMALEDIDINLFAGVKWATFITVLLAAVILFFPTVSEFGVTIGLYTEAFNKAGFIRFGIYAALAILGLVATAVVFKMTENRSETFFNSLTVSSLIYSAVSVWLYLSTELEYAAGETIFNAKIENSALLDMGGLSVNSVAYYCRFVSVIAVGALLIYIIFCVVTRKARGLTKYPYPEGEALIVKWQERDEEDDVIDISGNSQFSLDSIAENLKREYPVNTNESEFVGGFNIVNKNYIDKDIL